MTDATELVEEAALGRFELRHGDAVVSHASFVDHGDVVVIPHVETAPEHRGNRYAARLLDEIVEKLRAEGRRVVPMCPFAVAHFRANPRLHDVLVS